MQRPLTDEQKKILVLALVGLFLSVSFSFVINENPVALRRSDIYLRWYAVDKLLSEDRNLYDSRNGEEVTEEVWGEAGFPWTVNFYYPAHLTVLIGPLALLPYRMSHLIWTTAGQVFYLVAVWLSMRLSGWPDSVHKKTIFIVMVALFIPYVQHTIWGQFNTIGVLSLVLCLYALHRGQHGLAGVLVVGLTFKPHATVLTLAFLLVWALFKRERWRFFLGFGSAMLAMWAMAEILQPGWVVDFLATLGGYGSVASVVDAFYNPNQLVAGALCLGALTLFVLNGRTPAESPAFFGCVSLSLAVWFLVAPIVGMMHVVVLPVAVVLLFSGLRGAYPKLYHYGLYGMVLIYALGIVGFAWGLSSPELYGKHIAWSELAYKVLAPLFIGLLSLPLCLKGPKTDVAST
jgi:hypothetical protein